MNIAALVVDKIVWCQKNNTKKEEERNKYRFEKYGSDGHQFINKQQNVGGISPWKKWNKMSLWDQWNIAYVKK